MRPLGIIHYLLQAAGRVLNFTRSISRRARWTTYLLISIFVAVLFMGGFDVLFSPKDTWRPIPHDISMATRVQPTELMSQPLTQANNLAYMPRYIHQSWKADELGEKMSRWSMTCRTAHPFWQWLLWTDQDNLNMVQKFFPWFLETYQALPEEINRADASRNMYMYLFGGMYADLDTECIKNFDSLFEDRGVSMSVHKHDLSNDLASTKQGASLGPNAFFGRMDYDMTDKTLSHVIPNAWMASTPGHPFFLFVLENLKAQVSTYRDRVTTIQTEDITGPMALYRDIQAYTKLLDKGIDVGHLLSSNPSYHLFDRSGGNRSDTLREGFESTSGIGTSLFAVSIPRIQLLPSTTIYPYAWNNAGKWYRWTCSAARWTFNARRCKSKVLTKDSYAISYWSHTWSPD